MSGLSAIEELRQRLPANELRESLAGLRPDELLALAYDWSKFARPSQMLPVIRPWSTWLVKAGRGFGKTRTGAESVRQWITEGFKQVNIVVRTKGDIEKILIRGRAGILAVCPPSWRPIWVGNKNLFKWPNGATSFVFTAEEPDALRGPEHEKLWCDEVASWRYDRDAWDMAQFGLRLGSNPQAIITTTPRPTKLMREIEADPNTFVTRGTTYENRGNLAQRFFSAIITKYEGSRLGRQELMGETLDDNPGALFRLSDIEGSRVSKLPPLSRIVVAMDPATTSNEDSDEWGIIAAGQDGRYPAHYFILADESGIYTPDEAGKVAVRLYHRLGADRIVGEANNGGDMIETILRYQDANISYRKITASRGKAIRAEPISALYEQHRVHHHGNFATLEDQMTNWNPQTDEESPDRLDANVWAITELASGADGWEQYAKSEVGDMQRSGILPKAPESRVLVDGRSTDKCECGSVAWTGKPGEQKCFKCGKDRLKG